MNIVETMDNGKRGLNGVAVTMINNIEEMTDKILSPKKYAQQESFIWQDFYLDSFLSDKKNSTQSAYKKKRPKGFYSGKN